MGFFGWLFLYILCGFTTVLIASLLERYTKFKFGFLNSVGEPISGAVGIAFFLWFLVSFVGTLYISWTLLVDMSTHFIKSDDPWGTERKPYVVRGQIPPLPKISNENHTETAVAKLRNALGTVYATSDILATMQVIRDSDKLEKMEILAKSSAIQAMEDKPRVMELLTQIEEENE